MLNSGFDNSDNTITMHDICLCMQTEKGKEQREKMRECQKDNWETEREMDKRKKKEGQIDIDKERESKKDRKKKKDISTPALILTL